MYSRVGQGLRSLFLLCCTQLVQAFGHRILDNYFQSPPKAVLAQIFKLPFWSWRKTLPSTSAADISPELGPIGQDWVACPFPGWDAHTAAIFSGFPLAVSTLFPEFVDTDECNLVIMQQFEFRGKCYTWNIRLSLAFNDVSFYILTFYLFIFREKGKEREREREKNIDARKKRWWVASCMHPNQGPNPQPRHVSWQGIEPGTLHFVGWLPTSWTIPVRTQWCIFQGSMYDLSVSSPAP